MQPSQEILIKLSQSCIEGLENWDILDKMVPLFTAGFDLQWLDLSNNTIQSGMRNF